MPSLAARPSHSLDRRVASAIRTHQLVNRSDKVLVAVSGGPDSVALLLALHALSDRWRLSLTVVHCHYGLRGAESDGDADFVRELCERLRLPFILRRLESQRAPGLSSSLQARAREARYRLFHELAEEMGQNRVALGHSADDQAETLLLRLLRGSGLRGMSGMSRVRDGLFIRPLLDLTRQEILQYLAAKGQSFRTDSSNAKDLYLRNRVRRELIPALKKLAPGAVRILARQADLLREDEAVLEALTLDRWGEVRQRESVEAILLDRTAFAQQPPALQRRLFRMAFERLLPGVPPPPFHVVQAIVSYAASSRSGAAWRWKDLEVTCEQRAIGIGLKPAARVTYEERRQSFHSLAQAETITIARLPWTGLWAPTGERISITTVSLQEAAGLRDRLSPNATLLDGALVPLPLTVRSWRPGDWFCPDGMKGRRKKLQDYFTDAKLNRFSRGHVPLVVSAAGLVWVAGHRVDERFRARAGSEQFLCMTIHTDS